MEGRRTQLPELLVRAVREFHLWRPGEPVVVAASGGPDSTALLHALSVLPPTLRPIPVAAHFDHGWRGPAAAERERAAVRAVAGRLAVEVVLGAGGGSGKGSPESEARRQRYAFLAAVAADRGARVVAVGHQRDDRVETVLLRLMRGAGARGLAGMRPRALLPATGTPPVLLVRPLWWVSRGQVLDYLRAQGLDWVEDPTNLDLSHPRNLLRQRILPELAAHLGPSVIAGILRSAANLAEDEAALSAWADRAPGAGAGAEWATLPAAIRQRVIQRWWRASGTAPLARRHIRALGRLAPGRRLSLPGGRTAAARAGGWILLGPAPPAKEIPLPVPGEAVVPGVGRIIASEVHWSPGTPPPRLRGAAAVGALAAVRLPLRIRPPRPGERLDALAGRGPRPLREHLRAAGVPVATRGLPRVVVDATGEVLWIAGVRQAAAFTLNPAGGRALLLQLVAAPDRDGATERVSLS